MCIPFSLFNFTRNTNNKPHQPKKFNEDGDDITWQDTVEFTFPIEGGRVIKVYDGDTITIAAKLPFDNSPLYRLSVRLNGIDTPEIKGKTDDEKIAAKQVKDALSNLILNKRVSLKNIQTEKYAVKYDGGTKKSPESWLKYRISDTL